jgi:hypothetical protein
MILMSRKIIGFKLAHTIQSHCAKTQECTHRHTQKRNILTFYQGFSLNR